MSAIPSMLSLFTSFVPGFREVDGGDALLLAKQFHNPTTGVVALAGGGQSGGVQVNTGLTEVATVATIADSVMLPPAIPGAWVILNNSGANSMQVFGQGANMGGVAAGDTIQPSGSTVPAATGVGVAQASAVNAFYICYRVGIWKQVL